MRSATRTYAAGAGFVLGFATYSAASYATELRLDVAKWHIVARESGPVNYYTVVADPARPYIHAAYRPGYKTAVLGYATPDDWRQPRRLRWSWRAVTLPSGGNECVSGKGDSAAVIYVTWRRALRWYTLKYVWSSVAPRGTTCDKKRNPFVAQDTVVLESGGPLGTWTTEDIDLKAEFRKHFEDGDASASIPDLLGIGLMSDGDQTHSASAADYSEFALIR